MDAVVNNVHAVDLVLGVEISIESLLNVVDNWSPRLVVVDEVSKTWGVNNGKTKTDTVLLNIGAYRLDGHGLWDDIKTWSLALAWWVQRSVKESVDQSRLSETGLAWIMLAALCHQKSGFHLPTTMTLKLNPLRTLLRCHWFGRFANPTYPVSFLRTMLRMSLACCAAIFGSVDATLCGISIGEVGFPLGTGAGEALVGAVGATPLEAMERLLVFLSFDGK